MISSYNAVTTVFPKIFSEGYGSTMRLDAAGAISHVTKSSQKARSPRICWNVNRKNGFNISVEDLRKRKIKIVVLGKESVGKTGTVVTVVVRFSFLSEQLGSISGFSTVF